MKKSDFDGLMEGLQEARRFAQGQKPQGMRIHVPLLADVAAIRAKTGLSQAAFADHIGVSLATLRNWEQGRRRPEGPARVLLALLARDPRIVETMLSPAA